MKFSSPTTGSTVDPDRPVFTGTGSRGAAITVTDAMGTTLCTTTVDMLGNWTCQATMALHEGQMTAIVTQNDRGTITTDTVSFLTARQGASSSGSSSGEGANVSTGGQKLAGIDLTIPSLALLALLLIAGATGTVLVYRRRHADETEDDTEKAEHSKK